ncbi:MAG: deoxynucleoside kinase [Candidatus Taylorbacteria bacterium]|nr:deoxynucleoside kinase [Candidatus Taylorbacteria bacterium]
MTKKKDRLIVIEGIDGSGKATQVKLLVDRLRKEGVKVLDTDFPRYGEKSAHFVEKYLRGEFGSAKEVGPYAASIFFSMDRYEASEQIREGLKKGINIISNRYTSANLGHQGGKIRDKKERDRYIDWLLNFEYKILGIPEPDLTILLDIEPKAAQKLIRLKGKRKYTRGKRDIHEIDLTHLKQAREAYLYAAKKYLPAPSRRGRGRQVVWKVIDCMDGKKILPVEHIGRDVAEVTGKYLR